MRIQSELCHIDDQRAIVMANGWIGEKNIGSALGEGKNVEEAENRAIIRLTQRINEQNKATKGDGKTKRAESERISSEVPSRINKSEISKQEITEATINGEKSDILSDWSDELAKVDQEIKRLGWTKKDENEYIQKTLGLKDRNRITSYLDLTHYIDNLRLLSTDLKPTDLEESHYRERLLEVNDKLIRVLGWEEDKCREYLMDYLQVSSRQHLTNSQLTKFNERLSKNATSKTNKESD